MSRGGKGRGSRRRVAIGVSLAALLSATALLAPGVSGGRRSTATVGAFTRVGGESATSHDGHKRVIEAEGAHTYALDDAALSAELPTTTPAGSVAARSAADPHSVVTLPAPDGSTQDFRVAPIEVMAPQLAAEHPEIQTFAGRGLDDRGSSVRITQSPLGFQASVRGGDLGPWYVDPAYHRDADLYASYYGAALRNRHGPLDESGGTGASGRETRAALRQVAARSQRRGLETGEKLRTYRLALISDPGYASYFGAANVTAAKVALINRVDQVYEDELAIRLVLIAQNDDLNLNTQAQMIAPNGPCGTQACYDREDASGCSGETLDRSRYVIGQIVGAENYDIGHLALGQDGGGIAGLGVVGGTRKGEGCTGLVAPDGDFYAVDYVAHEMGHQFGGSHTFNGQQGSCLGNGIPGSAVEPGSGSSIMAYAGICTQDNLQPHSDPYFSERSFTEAESYVSSSLGSLDEVQSIALTHFGGGNEIQTVTFGPGFKASSGASATTSSFKLRIGGVDTVKIGGSGGLGFNATALTGALNTALANPASTLPDGTTVSVSDADTGRGSFSVTYGGASAGSDVANLQITSLAGCASCFNSVEETRHGGTPDSFKLSYGANTSSTITFNSNYTTTALRNALLSILPPGTTVNISGYGGASSISNSGFEIGFSGGLAGQQVPDVVEVTNLTGVATATSMRTDVGGPVANHGVVTTTGNTPPSVTAPTGYTIPYRTPFTLKGSGSDADNDALTYMWEQTDHGNAATELINTHKTRGPLFRQFGTRLNSSIYDEHAFDSPGENDTTADPSRTFPDLNQILVDNTDAATGRCPGPPPPGPPATGTATNLRPRLIDCLSEYLPKPGYAGPMHFRLTARDGSVGGGGVASDDTTVKLAKGTGPFLVKVPNKALHWKQGSRHLIRWDVAGTFGGKIKARRVKILLSTDGGQTYPTRLAKTKNDGKQSVALPALTSDTARIKIAAAGNVFFDVSDADFRITP